jgi:ribokinase
VDRSNETAFFIGDVAMDEYFRADRWPGIADKAYVTELRGYVGGMIANAACVYAGLGGRAQFISLLNRSALSVRLCQELNQLGVGTEHMLYDPAIPESRNLIFLVEGEHVVLTVDMGEQPMELHEQSLAALRTAGYLYTTLRRVKRLRARELSGPGLLADLRTCGRRLVFDLDVVGFAAADLDYLRGTEVLILNQSGFQAAFGAPDLAAMNQWMREHDVKIVIRTLAASGAEAYDGRVRIKVDGYRVPVVDVTGAGDTFGGALVYALSSGLDLPEALQIAAAAGSRSVMAEGPHAGIASMQAIEQFRREFQSVAIL